MYHFKKLSILTSAILITGCLSAPKNSEQSQPIEYFQPSQTTLNTATIIGDRIERKSILADTVAYVFAIDGKKVIDAEKNLNIPLKLEAGERNLQLWCQQGGFKYTNVLTVHLEANKNYQVDYQFHPNGKNTCYLWIYDLDAKKGIGELTEGISLWKYADPQKMQPMAKYIEPTPSAGSINVPIIINNYLK